MSPFWCRLISHAGVLVEDAEEQASYAEDLIAGTGSVVYSGTCPRCGDHITWTESLT